MKRSQIVRRTPFLRAGQPLGRGSVIRQQSARRARQSREYTVKKRAHLEANPVCERCHAARATDLHHRANRSQSTHAYLDETIFAALCRSCHEAVGADRPAAVAEGWQIPGYEYRKGLAS